MFMPAQNGLAGRGTLRPGDVSSSADGSARGCGLPGFFQLAAHLRGLDGLDQLGQDGVQLPCFLRGQNGLQFTGQVQMMGMVLKVEFPA